MDPNAKTVAVLLMGEDDFAVVGTYGGRADCDLPHAGGLHLQPRRDILEAYNSTSFSFHY